MRDMRDPWTAIHRAFARVESGIDPDQYRFITHTGEMNLVREGLEENGVPKHLVRYYNIHESDQVDPGTVLILDIFEIHRN